MKPLVPVIALLLLCLAVAPAAALADLVVQTFDPPAGPVERTFAIPNAVENIGDVDAGPFTVGFALSSDTTPDLSDTLIGSRAVPSLAAGATTQLRSTSVTVPASIPAGSYYLVMVIDTGLAITESDKYNNILTDPDPVIIPPPPAPDLGAGHFLASAGSVPSEYSIDAEVRNYGDAPAGAFTVAFFLSTDITITATDQVIRSDLVPSLAPGTAADLGGFVSVPSWVPAGTYYLGMVIDTGSAVTESNEANNTARAANRVTVPEAPPEIAWERMLGGTASEEARSVQQTSDGGYVLLGSSLSSQSFDVADTTNGGTYDGDFWLVKTDAAGVVQWQNLLGGSKEEDGWSVQQTTDGGYIALGSTNTNADGDVSGTNRGSNFPDYWLVKVNATGGKMWDRVIGGPGPDIGLCVQQTTDGGYILVGDSDSNKGGDVSVDRHGDTDIWVVKVNATGGILWEKMIGGSSTDRVGSVQQTTDGSYIILGSSGSNNFDASGTTYGGFDFWVVKLGTTGAIDWQKHLGGSLDDFGSSVRQTSDGGYILLGESKSSSSGIVTEANNGPVGTWDAWAVKLNSVGTVEWNRLIGGSGDEHGRSIRQIRGGGYVLLADSSSSGTGDVMGTTHGFADYWLVRLDSAGTILWQRLYGGGANDYASSMQQTTDGGFILAGSSGSGAGGDVTRSTHGSSDFWLVKLNGTVPAVLAVPPSALLPTDTNGDGLYEDVNGNGRKDFADVVLFFNQMTWIAANEPIALFDYNSNGRIDFADVVWLFNHL